MQDNEKEYFNIISQNIRKYRNQKGFSQEFLAEQIDCSREFINRVENQKEEISLKLLLKSAAILEVLPQQLFEKQF